VSTAEALGKRASPARECPRLHHSPARCYHTCRSKASFGKYPGSTLGQHRPDHLNVRRSQREDPVRPKKMTNSDGYEGSISFCAIGVACMFTSLQSRLPSGSNAASNPLPLILAGPISRKVTSSTVLIWLALSNHVDVTLSVYSTPQLVGVTVAEGHHLVVSGVKNLSSRGVVAS